MHHNICNSCCCYSFIVCGIGYISLQTEVQAKNSPDTPSEVWKSKALLESHDKTQGQKSREGCLHTDAWFWWTISVLKTTHSLHSYRGPPGSVSQGQCRVWGQVPLQGGWWPSVEEKESRSWRRGESLGVKSLAHSILCIEKIIALLGEKKDPCVNFRVVVWLKVPRSFWKVWCLRERCWPHKKESSMICLPVFSLLIESVELKKIKKSFFLEIIKLIFGGIGKFVVLIYANFVFNSSEEQGYHSITETGFKHRSPRNKQMKP